MICMCARSHLYRPPSTPPSGDTIADHPCAAGTHRHASPQMDTICDRNRWRLLELCLCCEVWRSFPTRSIRYRRRIAGERLRGGTAEVNTFVSLGQGRRGCQWLLRGILQHRCCTQHLCFIRGIPVQYSTIAVPIQSVADEQMQYYRCCTYT